jgi:DNA-binding LacI/PurR family transcriptional regulator
VDDPEQAQMSGADDAFARSTGVRRPTMADVAARVGVSRALVSLVFRNAEGASQQSRERVFQAAAELGYQPDTAARVLRRHRSRQLGVVYAMGDPYEADLVEAIYSAAERRGYNVVLGATTSSRDERKAGEDLLGFRSEALILLGPESPQSELAPLAARIPVVTTGKRFDGAGFDSVRTNDSQGVRQAVDHLGGLGHRAIAHINAGILPGAAERRNGYRNTMRRRGLHDEINLISGDYSEDSGSRAARELLRQDRLPTAVIAGNDRCAVGLLDSLLRVGINVPQEVSVVGYDDSQLARMSHINLTTVRQDVERTAESVVRSVIERLDAGRTEASDIVLKPALVVRGTTAPPRGMP